MNEPLTPAEQNYLKTLQDNPLWVSILNKVLDYEDPPSFNTKDDPSKQTDAWKYKSGGLDKVKSIRALLTCNTEVKR